MSKWIASSFVVLSVALGCASALTAKNPPFGQLAVKGTQLVDSSGNAVQLRGMSLFWSQWMGQYWTADVVQTLACSWNANVIRAAMGVDQGGYTSDPTGQFALVKTVVEAAIANGIYVIVDWHLGDTADPTPYQSQAISFFQQIATAYGSYPHADWNSVIKPYHEAIINAVRPIDPDNIFVLGTPSWSGADGITAASNSPITDQTNVLYVQHFYSGTHKDAERAAFSAAAAKIPVFISAYGISEADGGSDGLIYTDEANKWFAVLDQYKTSYVNWAVDDKSESSAALLPGTAGTAAGVGTASNLSPSGTFIRAMLLAKNSNPCNSTSSPSPTPASSPASTAAPTAAPTAASTAAASPAPASSPSSGSSGTSGVSVNVQTVSSWSGGAQHHYHYKKSAFFIISWQLIVSDILTQIMQLVLAVPITGTGRAIYGEGWLVRSLASLDSIAYYGTLFFSFLMTLNRATVFFSPSVNSVFFRVPKIYGTISVTWILVHIAPLTLNMAGCYKNFGAHGRYAYYDCSEPTAKQVYQVWNCIKTYLPIVMLAIYFVLFVYLRYVSTMLANRIQRNVDRKTEYRLLLQSFLICGSLEVRDVLFNLLPYLNPSGQWSYVLNYTQNLILIFNNTLTPVVMFTFNSEIRARCSEMIGGLQSRPSTPNFVNIPQTFTNVVAADLARF